MHAYVLTDGHLCVSVRVCVRACSVEFMPLICSVQNAWHCLQKVIVINLSCISYVALKLLSDRSQDMYSPLAGTEHIINYLQGLGMHCAVLCNV